MTPRSASRLALLPALAGICAAGLFAAAPAARAQASVIAWTPEGVDMATGTGNSQLGHQAVYGTEDVGTVISYGTVNLGHLGGGVFDFAVCVDAASNLTKPNQFNNSFDISVDGLADWNSNVNASGDAGISIKLFQQGTLDKAALAAAFDPGDMNYGSTITTTPGNAVPGSSPCTEAKIGVTSPNHPEFTTLATSEVYHVGTNGGGGFSTITDPDGQLALGTETTMGGYDFNFNVDPAINPASNANYSIDLPSSPGCTYSFRRPGDGGQNSAIGFTGVIPEPSGAALAALALGALALRRRR